MSNYKSLEVYVTISRKKNSCTIFDKKHDKTNDKKQSEQKSWELTVCYAHILCIVLGYLKSP